MVEYVKNIVGKGENDGYHIFKRLFIFDANKSRHGVVKGYTELTINTHPITAKLSV